MSDENMLEMLSSLAQNANALKGEAQLDTLDDISSDFENVRAAWKWAVTQGNWQLLDKAAESLFLFLRMRKRPGDGGELFGSVRNALAISQDTAEQLIWARMTSFLYALGEQGETDFDVQQRELESALQLIQRHGTTTDQAHCYQALAYLANSKPDWERALDYARQSLNAYKAVDDPFYVGRLNIYVGYFAGWAEGDDDIYRESHQRALEIALTINDVLGINLAASNLGWADTHIFGDYEQAAEHARLAIKYTREQDATLIGHNNVLLGLLGLLDGELDTAREHLMSGEVTARELNDEHSLAFALGIRAALESVEENYQVAKKLAEESNQAKTNPSGDFYGHWGMAMACIGLQEFDLVRKAVREALGIELTSRSTLGFDLIPCAAVLLNKDGLAERAVEVLSLSFNDPRSAQGWMQKWRIIRDLKAGLKEALGDEVYQTAWERGKTLELPTIVGELREHFGDENRN